jgi:hypothetical protein
VQAYNNPEKASVLTQSLTIIRVSQRLILCITIIKNHDLYLRDISQAYVQSATNLNREFYIQPPCKLPINNNSILKVLKPLYRVLKAGNHWFKTYYIHHTKNLNITQSTYNPCLLYSNKLFSIVGLQTNNTLFLADKTFADTEENKLYKAKFMAKKRERLTVTTPLKFNRAIIQLVTDRITLTQERQCTNLCTITTKITTSTRT